MMFSVFLIHNIQLAHKEGVFQSHTSISDLLLKNKQTNKTSIQDIEYIDIWMTFGYINFIFNLPENYLKEVLHIDNTHYPNFPIGRYIKDKKLDKDTFIQELKDRVREYIVLHPIK
jgi:hypothetical protein